MKTLKKALLVSTLSLASLSAQANLVEYDWKDAGDNKVSYNEASGLLWLDLSETRNMSINEAQIATSQGGLFEDWRLATHDEVFALASSIFTVVTDKNTYIHNKVVPEAERAEHAKMGPSNGAGNYSYGVYAVEGSEKGYFFGSRTNNGSTHNLYYHYDYYPSHDSKSTSFGVYLVSNDSGVSRESALIKSSHAMSNANNVSSPMALSALGLFGLMAFRRKAQ